MDLGGDGLGVGGVAGEDLDGDGAAVGFQEEAVVDLGLAALAVAVVPVLGQGAVGALDVAGGEVVEDQAALLDVAVGEPVHGRVELVLVGCGDVGVLDEGGVLPPGGGGELGVGFDDAGDDHGQDEVAFGGGRGVEQGLQSEAAAHGADGGDVAMQARLDDFGGLIGGDELIAAQGVAEQGDDFRGKGAEVAESLLLDLAVLAVGAAEEVAG